MKHGLNNLTLFLVLFSLLLILSCSSSTKPNKVANPILTPPGGLYSQTQQVSISCATDGADIRYSVDGSTPPVNSYIYIGSFDVPLGTTVKAYAVKAGREDSDIVTHFYSGIVPTPEITPSSGSYIAGTYIRIAIDGLTSASSWEEGISVRYTLDGSEPDTTSALYEFPFTLDAPCTLKAKAYRYNWTPSPVVSADYSIYPLLNIIGSYDTNWPAIDVVILNNYAYVADYDDGLLIIDVSNPANPFLTGSWNSDNYSMGVAISGYYAFVADQSRGLRVIRVSNPSTPSLTATIGLNNSATAVKISGNYAYVTNMSNQLYIVDISNPIIPSLCGFCNLPEDANSVAVSGSYVYLADGGSGLQVIDVSDPFTPFIAGSCDTPGNANGITVSGDYAYLADSGSGLQVINISNPTAPYLTGNLPTPYSARYTAVSGNIACISVLNYGMLQVDITNPAAPVITATCNTPGYAYNIDISGNYAYFADGYSGLQIIELE